MERKVWIEPFDARLIAGGVALGRGEVLGIRNARGALVFVESGSAWITQDHDRRDVVVTAGDWFRLDRDGTALVQAIDTATVTVTAPASGDGPEIFRPGQEERSRRGTFKRRLLAWWLRLHHNHPYSRAWDIRQQTAPRAPAHDPIAPHRGTARAAERRLADTIALERGRFA
jgi:hypothetical protein